MLDYNFLRSKIDFIKYPIVTEKSASLFDSNKYTFLVDKRLNKLEIQLLIEFLFNVKITKVNTLVTAKKQKRLGKYIGYSSIYKKAIVKLAPNNTINLFRDV